MAARRGDSSSGDSRGIGNLTSTFGTVLTRNQTRLHIGFQLPYIRLCTQIVEFENQLIDVPVALPPTSDACRHIHQRPMPVCRRRLINSFNRSYSISAYLTYTTLLQNEILHAPLRNELAKYIQVTKHVLLHLHTKHSNSSALHSNRGNKSRTLWNCV